MTTLSFKVSDDEARRIRNEAKREHLSISEYLRRRAIAPQATTPLGKVRCEITGTEIFAPLTNENPLTTAEVRRILADFP